MPEDDFTFRHHFHLQIDGNFAVQTQRHLEITKPFDGFTQVNSMSIDLVAALLYCFG